jgi:hypothetical protein
VENGGADVVNCGSARAGTQETKCELRTIALKTSPREPAYRTRRGLAMRACSEMQQRGPVRSESLRAHAMANNHCWTRYVWPVGCDKKVTMHPLA